MTWLDELEKRAKAACEGETQYFVELYGDEVLRLVRGYRAMQSALENVLELERCGGTSCPKPMRAMCNNPMHKNVREALSLAREMGEKK